MRITAPAMGGLAIVLAAALVWFFSPEPPQGPPAETPAGLPAVDEPVPPPTAEPPQPQAAQAVAPVPADAGVDQTPPKPPFERAPLPGETPRLPMAELVAERRALVTRSGPGFRSGEIPENIAAVELEFATEPVDRTWAPAAEAAIYAGLAQISGLTLIDQRVECRSTMCRVELTQPRSATDGGRLSFNMLRDSVGLQPRWMLMGAGASAAMRSVGYFDREGFAPNQRPREPHVRIEARE